MACSPPMSKRKPVNEDSPRSCRPRAAGELVGDVGGQSFSASASSRASIVSRWAEIVGERYASVSSPKSIRFPPGRKAGGALTLLVEGAHAPLIQHLAPMIIERVNRFFGHAAINRIVFRQGKLPAPAGQDRSGRQLRPVPKELGEGLREIADPELRACLESLASQIAASSGPPSLAKRWRRAHSGDQPEQLNPMKFRHFARLRGRRGRPRRMQQEQQRRRRPPPPTTRSRSLRPIAAARRRPGPTSSTRRPPAASSWAIPMPR